MRSQNTNPDRRNNHDHKTTHETSDTTVWLDIFIFSFPQPQQRTQSSRVQVAIKADRGIKFHKKKKKKIDCTLFNALT